MRLLEWTRDKPSRTGHYFVTTLWGKVVYAWVEVFQQSRGPMVSVNPYACGMRSVADFDPRVYWYGPIGADDASLWRREPPTTRGYYAMMRPLGELLYPQNFEYLDVIDGQVVYFDDLHRPQPLVTKYGEDLLWHGSIPRPPIECMVCQKLRGEI